MVTCYCCGTKNRCSGRMSAPLEGDCDGPSSCPRVPTPTCPNECVTEGDCDTASTFGLPLRFGVLVPSPGESPSRQVRMSAPLEGDCDSCWASWISVW